MKVVAALMLLLAAIACSDKRDRCFAIADTPRIAVPPSDLQWYRNNCDELVAEREARRAAIRAERDAKEKAEEEAHKKACGAAGEAFKQCRTNPQADCSSQYELIVTACIRK